MYYIELKGGIMKKTDRSKYLKEFTDLLDNIEKDNKDTKGLAVIYSGKSTVSIHVNNLSKYEVMGILHSLVHSYPGR